MELIPIPIPEPVTVGAEEQTQLAPSVVPEV